MRTVIAGKVKEATRAMATVDIWTEVKKAIQWIATMTPTRRIQPRSALRSMARRVPVTLTNTRRVRAATTHRRGMISIAGRVISLAKRPVPPMMITAMWSSMSCLFNGPTPP